MGVNRVLGHYKRYWLRNPNILRQIYYDQDSKMRNYKIIVLKLKAI